MSEPLGVVLAGGRSSRMGISKAGMEFDGAPLIERPLRAIRAAGLDAVVVAKPATRLPPLDTEVWREPEEPVHPLTGIVAALERARRPLVVCGCDLPFVSGELLAHLAQQSGPLVVVEGDGRLHPLIGRYDPRLVNELRDARDTQRSLHAVVSELHGERLDAQLFGEPARMLFNVNTPADLARAEEMLRRP